MDADIEINNENRIRNDDTLRKGKISNQKIRHEQAYTNILSDCIWAFDDSELSTFFSEFNTYDFKWSQLLFDCTQRNKNKENLFALEFFSMGISAVTFQKKGAVEGFQSPLTSLDDFHYGQYIRIEKNTKHCQQFNHSFLPELEKKTMAIKDQSLT